MEMKLGQIIIDSAISANWVMSLLLLVAIYFQKRANDKADQREKKIDSILERQQEQLNNHEITIRIHSEKLKSR